MGASKNASFMSGDPAIEIVTHNGIWWEIGYVCVDYLVL